MLIIQSLGDFFINKIETKSTAFKATIAFLIILFMANLSAIIDYFYHPTIPYFDHEHIIVGAFTGFFTLTFFYLLNQYYRQIAYANRIQKALIKRLSKEKERAEESDRLKSAFLANMSHEIRTPLNAIMGFSGLLRKENLKEEKKQLFLKLIQEGGERLLTIISDIIDISKLDVNQLAIHPETINLNELFDILFHQFSLQLNQKNVMLSTHKELLDNECEIEIDRVRLTQILSNMLENAIKFTEKGTIEFAYFVEGDMLHFYVKDSGIGIDPVNQQRIFERFSQIEDDKSNLHSGTGLGLSIAKGLVFLLNGKIWIESELGTGSTFHFTIPFVPSAQTSKNNIDTPDISFKNSREIPILIVEDEESNFIYLQELLYDCNVKLYHAKNGIEALDLFKQNKEIDLVFMDLKMPVMDGFEATKELRKLNPRIPIIAQTSYAMSEDKAKAINAGCNDCLAKPISEEVLIATIRTYIPEHP
jgi:signal transduction histidine kinase/ActR/RegA family two-component response regulator